MNVKCIITTKINSFNINTQNCDIYYIEDWIGFGNIEKARFLVDRIYLDNRDFINKYDYDGYKITWSWYGDIYQFCLKCTEIEKIISVLKDKKYLSIELIDINNAYTDVIKKYFFDTKIVHKEIKISYIVKLKEFIMNAILLSWSILSIIYFAIRRKKNTAISIGDMIYKNTTSDFRQNHLYTKLHENDVNYVEFIRTKSLKDFFVNAYKRKRFSIYCFSFIYFISLFTRNKYKLAKSFEEAVMFSKIKQNNVLFKTISLMKQILRICNISTAITLNFSSRRAHLVLACKSLKIKTIGMPHGTVMKEYMVNEFMESYNEDKFIGPDVFGTWSKELEEYYKKYCKIVEKNKIFHAGLLTPLPSEYFIENSIFKKINNKIIKVLIISEPLVNPKEILPYIKEIIECDEYEVAIKVRPMVRDVYYEELKKIYPEIVNIKKYDGKISEDGQNFDVFIGSYSTAVVEASLIGKISFFVKTEKWGDYFSVDNMIKDNKLLCTSSHSIVNDIEYRVNNEIKLNTIKLTRDKFFGGNEDGGQWIVNQIKGKL